MKAMRAEAAVEPMLRRLPGEPAAATAVAAPRASAVVLDFDALRAFGGDIGAQAFPVLLDTFLREMRTWLQALPAQVAGGDLSVVQRTAHNIKSCAGTLGAELLRGAAEALELAARDGDAIRVSGVAARIGDTAAPALDAVESFRETL